MDVYIYIIKMNFNKGMRRLRILMQIYTFMKNERSGKLKGDVFHSPNIITSTIPASDICISFTAFNFLQMHKHPQSIRTIAFNAKVREKEKFSKNSLNG